MVSVLHDFGWFLEVQSGLRREPSRKLRHWSPRVSKLSAFAVDLDLPHTANLILSGLLSRTSTLETVSSERYDLPTETPARDGGGEEGLGGGEVAGMGGASGWRLFRQTRGRVGFLEGDGNNGGMGVGQSVMNWTVPLGLVLMIGASHWLS